MDAARSSALVSPHVAAQASRSYWRANRELFILPVVVMLVVIPQYGISIHYNEAMFVVFGREILAGGLPYRDLLDQKPPLIYYFYAAVQALTGDGFMVARVLIYASLGVTSMLVALIAREFYSRRLAFVSGLAFALSAGQVLITRNAGLDQLTLLPLTAATYWVLRWRRERTSSLLVRAGIALGLALLLKPVVLPTAVLLAALVLLAGRRLRPALILTASALCVGLLALAAIAASGILPEAYDAIFVFGKEYTATGWRFFPPLPGILGWGLGLSALLLPAIASLVAFSFRGGLRLWFLGGLLLASLVAAALPGRFLHYYAVLLTVPLALLAPGIFEWMGAQRRAVRLAVLAPGAFVSGLAVYLAAAIPGALEVGEVGALYRRIGNAVAAGSVPGDRIWVRANTAQVYYYAGLRPAHRYFVAQGIRSTAEAEAVADLTATPPRFIVVDDREDFAPLLALLEARYEVLVTDRQLIAYQRRD